MGASHRFRHPWLARLMALVAPALLSLTLVLLAPGGTPAALAADNPQLLPDHPTPVIDLARALSEAERASLEDQLSAFEQANGWKLRVLTQYERTPGLAVKDFWNLDERSLLLVADPRGGNLLNFNVGDALFALMPRTFWVELQTRYGNQYYVRDHGEDGAIVDALAAVETCLERGGCQVVPGLPREQWILTFCSSVLGGVVAGIAAFPRKPGERLAWAWVLLLSPLWGILFVALGLGPVITRTPELLPVLRNSLGFGAAAVVAYLIAQRTVGDSRPSES
ncbi:MAG: TPM domain-containing protein [Prochlorococcaceae cyanobacterium]